jgi:L-malate glycosyltransferase
MIRVCHLISGDLWAGAEVMAFQLIKAQRDSGNLSVSAIVFNEGTLCERLRDLGVEVHVFEEKKYSFFPLLLKIVKVLKNQKNEIVHSHRYKENLLAFLASLFLPSIRLVSTLHGLQEKGLLLRTRLFYHVNFFLLSRFYLKTVAVSSDMHIACLKQMKFKPEKVAVVHNGIAVPPETRTQKRNDVFVVGSCGRFFPVKNYPLMVEIARILKPKTAIVFKLAGDGPGRPHLESLIAQYGLESSFELCGHKSDLTDFYRGLDVFINTSLHEGIPMSILEAMSYAVPVVGSKTGGIKEIIEEGKDGFFAQSGDAEGFAQKCLFLFENPEAHRTMGKNAREKIISSFSIQSCAEGYLKVYKQAMR